MANIPFVDDREVIDLPNFGQPGAGMVSLLVPSRQSGALPAAHFRNFKSIDWFFSFTFDGAQDIDKIGISFIEKNPLGAPMGAFNMEYSSLLNVQRVLPFQVTDIVSISSNIDDPAYNTLIPGSIVIDVSLLQTNAYNANFGFILSTPIIGDLFDVYVTTITKSGAPAVGAMDKVWIGYLRRAHREWISR